MNSSSPSFLRSLAALVSVHLATLLGGIALPVAITRIAGAEALGVFTSASALALLALTFSDWGYETELPIAVSRDKSNAQEIIQRALRVKFILWSASCCILALVALAQTFSQIHSSSFSFAHSALSFFPLGAYLGWALARTVTNTYIGAARGAERFGAIARVENLCAFASYTFAVVLFALIASSGRGVPGAEREANAVGLAVGAAVLCLVAGEYAKTLLLQRYLRSEGLLPRAAAPAETFKQALTQTLTQSFAGASVGAAIKRALLSFRDALKGGRSSFVALQLFSVAQSRAGMYALIAFSTEAELGYFSAAARFIIALRVVPGAAFQVLLPRFARTSSARADELPQTLAFGAAFGVGLCALLSVGAELCLGVVYGVDFVRLAPVLRILAWLLLLQTLSNILEPYLLAQGRERFVAFSLGGALLLAALVAVAFPIVSATDAAYFSLALEFGVFAVFSVKVACERRKKTA